MPDSLPAMAASGDNAALRDRVLKEMPDEESLYDLAELFKVQAAAFFIRRRVDHRRCAAGPHHVLLTRLADDIVEELLKWLRLRRKLIRAPYGPDALRLRHGQDLIVLGGHDDLTDRVDLLQLTDLVDQQI